MKKGNKTWNAIKIPLFAILCSLVAGGVIIAVTGSNPFRSYYALLQGSGLAPKASYANYKNMLTDFFSYVNYFTPMIFAALAVAVALRAGLFNIGVSGQMLAAGFTATVLVGYSGLGSVLAKPLVLLVGMFAGGAAGAPAAYHGLQGRHQGRLDQRPLGAAGAGGEGAERRGEILPPRAACGGKAHQA